LATILIIGGAGYIGGALTDLLVRAGHAVTVFDNLTYEERFLKDIEFVYGDIRDTNLLVSLHGKFDHVIWLAAIVGDGACAQDPELTYEVNYLAVKRFLERTGRRLIFPSTCSVYGAQHDLLTENSPTHPLSAYAETKLRAEEAVLRHGGIAFRLGTLFGLGDRFSRLRLDLVVNVLTLKAIAEQKITLFGGEQWRPVLAVRDVCGYLAEAIEHDQVDVYNVCYENIRISELAPIFKAIFPGLEVEYVAQTFEDLRNYHVSRAKADGVFAFRPSTTLASEIERMRDVLTQHRIKNPLDPRYHNTHYVRETIDVLRRPSLA
jgi:nucleoside-diphosphate-sugar epimerase